MSTQHARPALNAVPKFEYNHPKNYFGIPIAEAAPGHTGMLVQNHVVRGAGAAKTGAQELGLITQDGTLTDTGEEVVAHARTCYGDLQSALEQFEDWRGTTNRFVEAGNGEWAEVVPQIVAQHPGVNLILRVLSDSREEALKLPELVHDAYERDKETAELMFIRGDVELPEMRSERADRLYDSEVYHTPTTCQLKTVMYHAGLITENGTDSRSLMPSVSHWELDEFAPSVGGDAL